MFNAFVKVIPDFYSRKANVELQLKSEAFMDLTPGFCRFQSPRFDVTWITIMKEEMFRETT